MSAMPTEHDMASSTFPLFKGACSGLLWSLIPLFLFHSPFEHYPASWLLVSSVFTGLIIMLLIWCLRDTLHTWKRRTISSLPILLVAQGMFSFLLTIRATWEGSWPERWIELTLAIYWVDVFGLLLLLFLPLTYITLWWVLSIRAVFLPNCPTTLGIR